MGIDALSEKVAATPAFADRLKSDPEAALRSIGMEPTPELLATVTQTGGGEELAARINEAMRFRG